MRLRWRGRWVNRTSDHVALDNAVLEEAPLAPVDGNIHGIGPRDVLGIGDRGDNGHGGVPVSDVILNHNAGASLPGFAPERGIEVDHDDLAPHACSGDQDEPSLKLRQLLRDFPGDASVCGIALDEFGFQFLLAFSGDELRDGRTNQIASAG